MPEETKRPWYIGRRLISIGYALTGLVLAGTAVFMVWTFGEGLGATPAQQTAYAIAHVALHAFGMLVAFSIGVFLIDRSIGWAVVVAVLALGVGGYGISNIAGFSAKNRISVSDAVRENDKRAIQRYEAARSDLAAKRDWAGGQSMSFEHSRYERLQFKGKEHEYQKMLDELRMPQVTAATVNADAGASVISRFFGSSDENWQVRFAVLIAVLMFIGEFFSFILCGRMWPTAATVAALSKSVPSTQKGGSGDAGSGVKSTEESKPKQDENVVPLRATDVKSSAVVPQSEKVGQPPPTVRRVQSGAPLPLTLKTSHVSIPALIAANPGKRWESISDLAKDAGVSVPTAWRAVENARGQGKVETSRKGRGVQVIAKPRKSGTNGAFHAYPH